MNTKPKITITTPHQTIQNVSINSLFASHFCNDYDLSEKVLFATLSLNGHFLI
jgi:hypothetical protein